MAADLKTMQSWCLQSKAASNGIIEFLHTCARLSGNEKCPRPTDRSANVTVLLTIGHCAMYNVAYMHTNIISRGGHATNI
jgi:hypothetical protein